MEVPHGSIHGYFYEQNFVCNGDVSPITKYKSGFFGFLSHLAGKILQKYASVGVDVYDMHSRRHFCLYVSPTKAASLARELGIRILGRQEAPEAAAPKPSFGPVGRPLTEKIARLKHRQALQLRIFEEYARNHQWGRFHSDHYDWWMFPIDRRSSSYGDEYRFSQKELDVLRNDPEFMKSYRRGVQLVALSYGWNTETNSLIAPLEPGQGWRHYGVRLGKMADSLRLLREDALLASMQQFARQNVNPALVERWVLRSLGLR